MDARRVINRGLNEIDLGDYIYGVFFFPGASSVRRLAIIKESHDDCTRELDNAVVSRCLLYNGQTHLLIHGNGGLNPGLHGEERIPYLLS